MSINFNSGSYFKYAKPKMSEQQKNQKDSINPNVQGKSSESAYKKAYERSQTLKFNI